MAADVRTQSSGEPRPGRDRYERRDARAKPIFIVVAGLAAVGVAMHLILAALYFHLLKKPLPTDAWRPAQPGRLADATPRSFPRLQLAPADDLKTFRAREDAELSGYGWIDRTAGVVRIPIDRAMELLLQRGLPVRTNQSEATK